MKNIINYYYNMYPEEISHIDDKYFFEYLNNDYTLQEYKRPLGDIDCLYKINSQMVEKNMLVHEIIINKEGKILTYINNVPYVLLEIKVNKTAKVNLFDICNINNATTDIECDTVLERYDWVSLWEAKNDYFEAQINEVGKKFPNLCVYANYYLGLAENAISYVRNASMLNGEVQKSVNHKRIYYNDTLYNLYNPINYVFDYKVRDVSEYIKSVFFNGGDAYSVIEEYFKNNYIGYKDAMFLYGRLLYPSYFFDLYDDIVNNELDEKLIQKIILKSDDYELFLSNIYILLSNIYKAYIPSINWIIKRSYI